MLKLTPLCFVARFAMLVPPSPCVRELFSPSPSTSECLTEPIVGGCTIVVATHSLLRLAYISVQNYVIEVLCAYRICVQFCS